MAIEARESTITRLDVMAWIAAWKKIAKVKRPPIEDYIRKQIDDLDLPDNMIAKAVGDSVEHSHVADLIISDLASYGVSTSS